MHKRLSVGVIGTLTALLLAMAPFAVGLPGFQFIQDPMDYDTRTHHSNMDVYDRIQAADLEQMAVIEAVFAYNAATRAEKLPRKDLPAPTPGRGGGGGRGRGVAVARPDGNRDLTP